MPPCRCSHSVAPSVPRRPRCGSCARFRAVNQTANINTRRRAHAPALLPCARLAFEGSRQPRSGRSPSVPLQQRRATTRSSAVEEANRVAAALLPPLAGHALGGAASSPSPTQAAPSIPTRYAGTRAESRPMHKAAAVVRALQQARRLVHAHPACASGCMQARRRSESLRVRTGGNRTSSAARSPHGATHNTAASMPHSRVVVELLPGSSPSGSERSTVVAD